MTDNPAMSEAATAVPVTGAALAPLRERYVRWMSLDAAQVQAEREEPVDGIRAMQLVLRMERGDPPSWHGALAASATAAAAICLDPRSEPGGEWHEAIRDYCIGHIRKVTRRARAGQWDALAELPSVLVNGAGSEVRAVLPGPVAEVDKRIAKLQVGGTDAPVDSYVAADGPGLELWIPPEPEMTLGKTMAQAGHAGMIAAALLAGDDVVALNRWAATGLPASVRRAEAAEWAELRSVVDDPVGAWNGQRLLAVRDAGFTEIAPGTVTVIARASF